MSGSSLSYRHSLLVILQQLSGTVLGILVGVVLARMLSTAAFGEYNAAFGAMMIVQTFASLGASGFITVPFRRAITSGEFRVARGLRRWIPLCIILSGIFAFGIVFTAHVVYGSNSAVRVQSFAAVLATVPLVALASYLVSTASSLGAAGRAIFISRPLEKILLLLGLGLYWLLGSDSFDVLDAAAVWAATILVICIALWRLNRTVEHPDFKKGVLETEWSAWAKGAFPYLLSGVVGIVLSMAPFIILGWISVNGEEAAMYSAAFRLGAILSVAGSAAAAIFRSAIADAIEAGSRQEYRKLIRSWLLLVGPATVIGLALIMIFGDTLLGFFGEAYRKAYWLLVVVSATFGLKHLASIFLSVNQYAGSRKAITSISVFWTLIGLAAMVVMGKYWQTMGIAFAQGGAFLGMYLTYVFRASVLTKRSLR